MPTKHSDVAQSLYIKALRAAAKEDQQVSTKEKRRKPHLRQAVMDIARHDAISRLAKKVDITRKRAEEIGYKLQLKSWLNQRHASSTYIAPVIRDLLTRSREGLRDISYQTIWTKVSRATARLSLKRTIIEAAREFSKDTGGTSLSEAALYRVHDEIAEEFLMERYIPILTSPIRG